MVVADQYKDIVANVAVILKKAGWSKKGDLFYIKRDANLGMIGFQKSMSNTTDHCKFTINHGVCSSKIREFNDQDLSKIPAIFDCHWWARIGQFLPDKNDHWWVLRSGESIEKTLQQVVDAVSNISQQKVIEMITDQALKALWLSGSGLTDLQRSINLTILLKATDDDGLIAAVEQLKILAIKRNYLHIAKEHIERLGLNY